MNFDRGVRAPHPADEDLLRHIDRQLDLEGARRVRAHLALCEGCAERAGHLRGESEAVSTWIAEIPVVLPDPNRRALALAAVERAARRRPAAPARGTVLLRAAAVVLLIVSGSLVTRPVRGWVGGQVESLVGPHPGAVGGLLLHWLGRGEAPAAEPELAPAVVAAPRPDPEPVPARELAGVAPRGAAPFDSPPVAFAAEGGELRLEFASLQQAGVARISIRDVPAATARVLGGTGAEDLVPVADGLEVRNPASSRATYEVTVPPRYRVLRVRVAGREQTEIQVSRSKQDWVWRIDLRQSARP